MNVYAPKWEFTNRPFAWFKPFDDAVTDKVLSFMNLPKGWHYGDGVPPTFSTALHAIWAIHSFRQLGAEEIEVFPDLNGEILVSAYAGNLCIDATILPTGLANYMVTEDDKELTERKGVSLDDLVAEIGGHQWLPGNLLGWSIPSTTAKEKADSNRQRSKTQMGPVFQWSMNVV